MKNTKHTIIDIQKKYIANLEKQVADLEKTLENTITPDETTKKLFNLLDQLTFVANRKESGGRRLCAMHVITPGNVSTFLACVVAEIGGDASSRFESAVRGVL